MKKTLISVSMLALLIGCHENTNDTEVPVSIPDQKTARNMPYHHDPDYRQERPDRNEPSLSRREHKRHMRSMDNDQRPPQQNAYPPMSMDGTFRCTFVPTKTSRKPHNERKNHAIKSQQGETVKSSNQMKAHKENAIAKNKKTTESKAKKTNKVAKKTADKNKKMKRKEA